MPMTLDGKAKLVEEIGELQKELGELQQIIGKSLQFPGQDLHPDGAGSLVERLENEMGDVLGSIAYAGWRLGLNRDRIDQRSTDKFNLFVKWSTEAARPQEGDPPSG